MKYSRLLAWTVGAGLAAGLFMRAVPAGAQEKGDEHPWSLSLSAGRVNFEGDFVTRSGFISTARIDYDLNEWWTLEGSVFLMPVLKGAKYFHQNTDGSWVEVDRLVEQSGVTQTWGGGGAFDGLFHFTPWKRVDPYLSLGVAAQGFANSFSDPLPLLNQADAAVRGGGGVIVNINDEWSVRGDFRGGMAGLAKKGTVASVIDVGVRYVFGAHVAPDLHVSGGPKDSDADGLTDDEEINVYHTNPFEPDTDHDGLSDGDEVHKYHTDPLNPDTDYDGLKDGPEVFTYHTDPTKRDTDGGGVADGHEVIEDHTNPLDPTDDLILFTLNFQFDYDQAIVKPEYFKELDVIGKTLQRDPGATARIEGHCDKMKKSAKEYNDKLSARRAKACLDYLAEKCGIESSRLSAIGFGFSRPKAMNDDLNGNPENRRVEVYIRKSEGAPAKVSDTLQPTPAK